MGIAAYKSIIRESESPRQIERRVLTRITGALAENAAEYDSDINSEQRLGILYNGLGENLIENQLFWNMLKNDLATRENEHTTELKASLLSIALWVERETNSVMGGSAGVNDLIAVNQNIISGLAGISPTIGD
ncbi:MAG: flaF protein [Rhodobacteraceae bacterium]|nr:MAG: flaF protein [Paracoccaceae bacterium]